MGFQEALGGMGLLRGRWGHVGLQAPVPTVSQFGRLLPELPLWALNTMLAEENICDPPLPVAGSTRAAALLIVCVGSTELSAGHGSF